MSVSRVSFACFVLSLGVTAALEAERLPVRLYTTDDGLASNQINRIVRDSRGFLWFCTREGVSRFDGYQFTNFGHDQGLPGRDKDLIETRSGEYWVATGDGVARLSPIGSKPEFTVYRPADPRARDVNALAEDEAGGIWCGTLAGLYHLERTGGGWALRLVNIGMPTAHYGDNLIEALLRDHTGNLWIGAHQALYRLSAAGRYGRCILRNNPAIDHVLSLLEDHQGRLWIGTWAGLLRTSIQPNTSEPQIEKVYTPRNGLAGEHVFALLESSDRQIWAGTSGGLSRYSSKESHEEWVTFRDANGLSHDQVESLGEDRAGNVWVGSIGAQKISRAGLVTYSTQDGLASNLVASIFEDAAGEVCVVTRSFHFRADVNCFDGRRFHSASPNVPNRVKYWGWGDGQITFQDHTGKWWVPTGQGLFRFPALSKAVELRYARPDAVFNLHNGLAGENVFRLFEDSRGDVWIATAEPEHGLTRWERGTATLHRYSVGPRNVLAFAEDREGSVWIAFAYGALARYRHGCFELLKTPKPVEHYGVRAIYLDRDGRLWLASRNGLVRVDSPEADIPRFTIYTTTQGLASNDVQCITQDLWGRIYVGTGHGVDCFYPRLPLHVRHYTKADGLAVGNNMYAFRDHYGALWFGTPVGLSRMVPEPERPRAPPPILISALRIRGVPRPISPLGEGELSGLKLGPDQNQIEVQFVALGFGTGVALRYQHRLEGADTDWSQPADERRIDYANLSPGNYRFQVRAVTSDGLVSAKPAAVAFTIAPPLSQRWWLRTLLLALIAAVIYALHRYRVTRLLEVERLRTRIATDLHDDIGSTLSQIAILSEVASRSSGKEEQMQPLSEIANLSRESVDSMSDIVWAIDPEQDHLGDLRHRMRRFASDLFASNGTRVRFNEPHDGEDLELSSELRRQIFLIFKESLHNAAKHSGSTEIEIDFRLAKASLDLTIRDNGKGFAMSQIQKGHGLLSIEQRAKEVGGRATVDSVPGRGTTICLQVPIRHGLPRPPKKTYTKG